MQVSASSGRCYQLRFSRKCLSYRATSSPDLIDLSSQPKLYRCFRRDSIHVRAAQNVTVEKGQGGAMRPPARVLLTNDDGPESTFFQAWVQHVKDVLKWNYVVCIPGQQQSFVSKCISHGPLQVTHIDSRTMHVNGSPATCSNLAIHSLVPDVDFVVSGPNVGHNVGRASVLSSGTLGAAMEASLAHKKAIAISFPFNGWGSWTDDDIATAVQMAGNVATQLWEEWQSDDVQADVFNVNVPLGFKTVDGTPVKPEVLRTTVDMQSQYSSLYKAIDNQEGGYEWGPKGLKPFDLPAPTAGGDVAAVKAGHVSISALRTGFIQPTAKV
ncbi:MAG: hypothetical protein FRX49_08553 [Trebouxia sp. A1-2]|nr:MAG: hypothetical protein FRX49_08553 [Trebouxia sp. A1-2]